jgi:hypothetical protein
MIGSGLRQSKSSRHWIIDAAQPEIALTQIRFHPVRYGEPNLINATALREYLWVVVDTTFTGAGRLPDRLNGPCIRAC